MLDRFRSLPRCEYCGKRGPLQPHHVLGKGIEGGRRIDSPLNLVGICLDCYANFHAGRKPNREDCLAIISRREGVPVDTITALVAALRRRHPNDPAEKPNDQG
jgi:hypothetical protein